MARGLYASARLRLGCSARAARIPRPAAMIFARVADVSAGTGKVFHVSVFANRTRDSRRPPMAFCQAMNIADDTRANCRPSVSSMVNVRSLAMVVGLIAAAM